MMRVLLVLLLGMCGASASEQFKVSKVTKENRPLFVKLFEGLKAEAEEPRRYQVRSKIEAKSYVCYLMERRPQPDYVRRLGPKGVDPKFRWVNSFKKVVVDLEDEPKGGYAPGETFDVATLKTTRVRKVGDLSLRVVAPTGKFTREVFIKRLKAGERFNVTLGVRCKKCFGSGRVTVDKGKRSADGKTDCPTCRGSGKEPREYVLSW